MTTVEWRPALGATGLLRTFNEAGVLEAADVHVAQRLTALAEEPDETVALAVALAVRALRGGSVCVDLRSVAHAGRASTELPWPDVGRLAGGRAGQPAGRHAAGAAAVDDDLLYLDRYWREEQQVADDLLTMLRGTAPTQRRPDVDRLFPTGYDEQRAAAESRAVAVADGADRRAGHRQDDDGRAAAGAARRAGELRAAALRIALAAPTGKAAARLQEAVQWRSTAGRRRPASGCRGCRRRRCTGCSGSRPDTRRGSGTTAATGCRTT